MHTVSTLLSWMLSMAPELAPEPFSIDDLEFYDSGSGMELATYDTEGKITGELAVWTEVQGIHLDVNFADGEWLWVDLDGDLVAIASSNTEEMIRRVAQMGDVLHELGVTEGSGLCAFHAAEMASSCSTGQVIACMAKALLSECM